jgi:hypothetical protein
VAVYAFHLVGPVANGTISLPTHYRFTKVPSTSVCVIWPGMATGRFRWCGVFQVVKTARSRERTERTLLTALSQLLWRDKGREVWFSLRENHKKACRFGLHQLRNCLRGDFYSPQAPSRGTGMLRTGVIRRYRCHISVCYTQVIMPTGADAFSAVGGRCTGRERRCKAKQGRRGKTALTCEYLVLQ